MIVLIFNQPRPASLGGPQTLSEVEWAKPSYNNFTHALVSTH